MHAVTRVHKICHKPNDAISSTYSAPSCTTSTFPTNLSRKWKLALINALEFRGNYSATSNNMRLLHWPLMGGLLHLVQRGGDWAGPQPVQAPRRCTKCNSPVPTHQRPVYRSTYCYIIVRCSAILMCPLMCNMKLVHWSLIGLLHLLQRGGDWAGRQPAQAPPRCTKCNSPSIKGQCTNHRIAV